MEVLKIIENHMFYKPFKRFKEKHNGKKGITTIENVVNVMIFLIVLALLVDLLILGWKFSVISQTNSYVTRTAGLQGGILSSAPAGYPGGNTAYIGTAEMKDKIDSYFSGAGFEAGDYEVRVNGRNVSSGYSTGEIDYRENISTEITVDYEWQLISNFVPGNLKQSIESTRGSVSEFKYRYDTWVGE